MKRKPFTLIELLVTLAVAIILLVTVLIVVIGGTMVYFSYQAGQEISENGVKPTAERIWVGKDKENE